MIRTALSYGAALLCATLCATVAHAEDLLAVYRLAQDSDPAYASARYALDAAREKIPQARANLLPVAAITANDGNTRADTAFTDVPPVDRNMKSWSWNLQLTQPLLRPETIYAYKESGYLVEQAEAQFAQARQDLLLRTAQAYFAVNVAQDAIGAADSQVATLEEQLAQVTRGVKLGTHSQTDIDDTRSRLGSAKSQRVAAQNDLESARAELEKIIGVRIEHLTALTAEFAPPAPSPSDPRSWMEQARSTNPAVVAQRAALEAARQDIKKNRAGHLPTLDLVANVGSNYSSHSLTTPDDFSTRATQHEVGVQLNVPLFAGGSVNSKVREATATMLKTQSDLEAASRQAATDAQQAYAGVMNGLAQVEALNTAVESGQSAVKGNRVGYKLGIRIHVDVLNAQQQLFSVERDLSKARYETLLQGLKLKAATGSLEESDLTAVNAMLR
ncbi:MAG TPA: TolC family outer membrane protein [Burkholderiaceae bacterium]